MSANQIDNLRSRQTQHYDRNLGESDGHVATADKPPMTTSIGSSTPEDIWVQGFNLVNELMGQVDFGSMSFLLISGRLPSPGEATVFNAILVAVA